MIKAVRDCMLRVRKVVPASTRHLMIIGGMSVAAGADAQHGAGGSENATMMACPPDDAERLEGKQSQVLAF